MPQPRVMPPHSLNQPRLPQLLSMNQRKPPPPSMPQQRVKPPLSPNQPRLPQLLSMPQPREMLPLSLNQQRLHQLPSMPQQRVKLPHSLPQLTPLLHLMPQPREKPPHSERGVFFVKHNKQKGISIEVRFQFEFREYSLYEIDNGYKCLSILYK